MRTTFSKSSSLDRRQVLRGSGVALSLPLLESMSRFDRKQVIASESLDGPPRRMIGICNNLGLLPDLFFPTDSGDDYKLSPYLDEVKDFRNDFTVLSGVSHPGVDGSHSSDISFLTAAPHPGSGGFRNSISLDQLIATKFGNATRFPSLTLGVNAKEGQRSLSWTDGGVLIPCQDSASAVFRQLFLQGSEAEVASQVRRLKLGQSIMDTLSGQTKSLHRSLGTRDRHRMDQFATAVRDVEMQLVQAQDWERKPKPAPGRGRSMPIDPGDRSDYVEKTRLMYQMAKLAVETDSTRAITILLDSNNSPTINVPGQEITDGYHNLSHHGKSESKLSQLEAIDRTHLRLLGELLDGLRSTGEEGATLLDQTAVLYGSNFGDANKHTTENMPILIAGGGFRHGRHLAFDRQQNYPLPNLFVSVLQQMGIETDRFASATGTMRGLEPV